MVAPGNMSGGLAVAGEVMAAGGRPCGGVLGGREWVEDMLLSRRPADRVAEVEGEECWGERRDRMGSLSLSGSYVRC